MNEHKENEINLSNDPIIVSDEIESIHRKIFHLRRTNTEIRKYYADDPDCIQALNENIDIIDQKLNQLFLYFDLYKELTTKQHFYVKLYESDLKMKDKLKKHTNYNEPSTSNQKLTEFDLDYVAQRLKQKSKELQENKSKTKNDDDCIVDDDGGFVL